MTRRTKEGLPIVTETTLVEFLKNEPIASTGNDPKITRRIKKENPQLYRLLQIGMEEAQTKEARVYYERGIQITYELLRLQGQK